MSLNNHLTESEVAYNFAFLDEYAKREIRRNILKAICLPGYQTPYASREMPMGRGFGTGGLQVTLSIIGEGDHLKVIDQGSDDSVNAVNLRSFIEMTCPGVDTGEETQEASIIQSRHRIPEEPLNQEQVLVLQVPYPDPLILVEPSEKKRKMMHGEGDYSRLLTKLYEDIVEFDEITIAHRYPTRINDHYVLDPSPIPRFDVPKLDQSAALILFGAGREKKIYALPPYTKAEPLAFDDVAFRTEDFFDEQGERRSCQRCGSKDSFLDEILSEEGRFFQCSDTNYCDQQLRAKEASIDKEERVATFAHTQGGV